MVTGVVSWDWLCASAISQLIEEQSLTSLYWCSILSSDDTTDFFNHSRRRIDSFLSGLIKM